MSDPYSKFYNSNNYTIPTTEQTYFLQNYGQVTGQYNNVTRDYNIAQGVSNPADLSTRPPRDINLRYVTVENSSPEKPVGIAITDAHYRGVPDPNANNVLFTPLGPVNFKPPPIKFSLAPGEIRHLGINTIGSPMQFIHILDLSTKAYLGDPCPFRTDANQFVLREGINKWFVQGFHRPSYAAAK